MVQGYLLVISVMLDVSVHSKILLQSVVDNESYIGYR